MNNEIVDPANVSENVRQPWDKLAWTVGGIGYLIIVVIASIPFPDGSSRQSAQISAVFGLNWLVLSPLLAGISKRRWLVWAYLPQLATYMGSIFRSFFMAKFDLDSSIPTSVPSGTVRLHDMVLWLTFLFMPYVFSVPVVIVRYWVAGKRRRALMPTVVSLLEQDSPDVWPPRPRS